MHWALGRMCLTCSNIGRYAIIWTASIPSALCLSLSSNIFLRIFFGWFRPQTIVGSGGSLPSQDQHDRGVSLFAAIFAFITVTLHEHTETIVRAMFKPH